MNKKAFGLISVLILLVIFSFLSISIIQKQSFSTLINQNKYLYLQAQIHMDFVKDKITDNKNSDIKTININDKRFELNINIDENDISKYHIYINTIDKTHIRIYDSLSIKH